MAGDLTPPCRTALAGPCHEGERLKVREEGEGGRGRGVKGGGQGEAVRGEVERRRG